MEVDILGSKWFLEFRETLEDDMLLTKGVGGYTDPTIRKIVIVKSAEMLDAHNCNFKEWQKRVIRHEIIHAFMFESGLGFDFEHQEQGQEELMVDWIAIQFPKILQVFKAAKAL